MRWAFQKESIVGSSTVWRCGGPYGSDGDKAVYRDRRLCPYAQRTGTGAQDRAGIYQKRLIHVFGSAGLRDHSKRPLMGQASGRYADIIVLTEEDYRTEDVNVIMNELESGMEAGKEVHRFPNRGDAIAFAISQATAGDVVIITGKGHEKSLCRGAIEFPWSDQEEVKKIYDAKKSFRVYYIDAPIRSAGRRTRFFYPRFK